MKTILIIYTIILFSTATSGKDFSKTEDIINNILKETPSETSKDPGTGEKMKKEPPEKSAGRSEKNDAEEKYSARVSTEDEVLLKTGIQLYKSELFTHARKKFKDLVLKFPQSPYSSSAKLMLGRIDLKEHKYKEAILQFASIDKDSGEYPAALFNLGNCYRFIGRKIKSIEYFELVSSQFPQHELADNALLNTGKIFLSIGKGNQALEPTVKLIKYYKTRETIDDAYYLLAKIFEKDKKLKDPEIVRKIYKKFLKKAGSGEAPFKNSPLKKRVERDLKYIEKNYFRIDH